MTDRIAVALGLIVAAALAADFGLNGGQGSLFMARRLAGAIEWAAFWR